MLRGQVALEFPEHKCSLSLEHNPHRSYHQTVAQWERDLQSASNQDDVEPLVVGWVDLDQRQRALAADDVWVLQWYPHTPVGSYRLIAHDLDVLLDTARRLKT